MLDIKAQLLKSMAGATSQKPISTELLYMLGARKEVEAALLELYQAHQVGCCLFIKQGKERIVWWPVGNAILMPHSYGRVGRSCGS